MKEVEAIGDTLSQAMLDNDIDTLISACPGSERPLSQAGADADEPLAVMDLFELVAQSAGIEGGGGTVEASRRGIFTFRWSPPP